MNIEPFKEWEAEQGLTPEPSAEQQALAEAKPEKLRLGRISKEEAECLCGMLDRRRFDINNPPPEPHAILKLGDWTIATAENIVMIQAKVKAGKTAVLGAIIASAMEPEGDCFSFSSTNPEGHAIIHFDTEQSRFHHHQVLSRALWRSGHKEPPAWLRSYYMKGLSIAHLRTALRAELDRAREKCGGVLMGILDGIGDFCPDVNDPAIATELVSWVEALAMEYQTSFVLVLHENPGSENGKTRGHLGSHLERKAETNLRLEKNAEGVTVIYSDRSRTAHIPKDKGPCFAWNNEAKMHISTVASFKANGEKMDPNAPRKNSASTAAKSHFAKFFARGASVRRSALAIDSRLAERTFDKYWGVLKDSNWIEQEKTVKSLWVASPAWATELAAEYTDDEE